ncbi:MAG: cobyrinate a,c-diamide synthase [Pseudomonadota bacterium]
MVPALIIGAPATGSGKTTLTIALLRALKRRGVAVAPAKIGPDYIDPQFHARASGRTSVNLDAWAMRPNLLRALAGGLDSNANLTLIEGVMGVFDGGQRPGRTGIGATADVARMLNVPILLVINCGGIAQSVAPLVHGFRTFDPSVRIAGVILNNTSSDRQRAMLTTALEPLDVPIVGALPRHAEITMPSRHLGLTQAEELSDLDARIDTMADLVEADCDLDALIRLASPPSQSAIDASKVPRLAPLGQRVAIADDVAFRFAYPHVLSGWRRAGAELSFFSPLANEAPASDCDAVFLPGGYPELHAERLAAASTFRTTMRTTANKGVTIYGECGGYMTLGDAITDADGNSHPMLGLLKLETSFARRRLHLGYRHVRLTSRAGLRTQNAPDTFFAHEFHYASIEREVGEPLFQNLDTGAMCGLTMGRVCGSYMHLIDFAADAQ